MARTLRKPVTSRRGPRGIYPWDKWVDGKPRQVKQGEDFDCSPGSFARNCYHQANLRGIDVRCSIVGDAVDFQFIEKKGA